MYLDVTDNDYVDFFADENRETFQATAGRPSPFELLKSMTAQCPFQVMPMSTIETLSLKMNRHPLALENRGLVMAQPIPTWIMTGIWTW
jgi:hypothetical protein